MQPFPYVITGGGSGIGQALAWQLAEQGEKVVIIGRRQAALATTSLRFPEHISMISADVSHEAGRDEIAQQLQSYTSLKGLIYAAVTILPLVRIGGMSMATWHHTQAVNVDPLVFLTQRLLPQLTNARVILFSSSLGRVAVPYLAS